MDKALEINTSLPESGPALINQAEDHFNFNNSQIRH